MLFSRKTALWLAILPSTLAIDCTASNAIDLNSSGGDGGGGSGGSSSTCTDLCGNDLTCLGLCDGSAAAVGAIKGACGDKGLLWYIAPSPQPLTIKQDGT